MSDETATLTIQETAQRSGVSAHTLRYYERIGLIAPVERASSGHRRYDPGDVDRVRLPRCLRETGMGIREMIRFVAPAVGALPIARERQRLVEAALERIEWKIDRYREAV